MIRTDKLRGIMYEKGYSQAAVARALGVSATSFYAHMKRGVFGSDEIEKMISLLDIQNPMDIFFAHE